MLPHLVIHGHPCIYYEDNHRFTISDEVISW